MARDKMIYAGLKQAWVVNKEELQGRSAAGMGRCGGRSSSHSGIDVYPGPMHLSPSGAVAAAAREMRPVEIVGLYEAQREGLEAELTAAKGEVRWTLEMCGTCVPTLLSCVSVLFLTHSLPYICYLPIHTS